MFIWTILRIYWSISRQLCRPDCICLRVCVMLLFIKIDGVSIIVVYWIIYLCVSVGFFLIFCWNSIIIIYISVRIMIYAIVCIIFLIIIVFIFNSLVWLCLSSITWYSLIKIFIFIFVVIIIPVIELVLLWLFYSYQ